MAVAPWNGPRHQSWLSDTVLTSVMAAVVIVAYIAWEALGTAPQGMVTLVGVAGGALFGAVSGDKRKREQDTERVASRADRKADALAEVADHEHPGTANHVRRAADGDADAWRPSEPNPSAAPPPPGDEGEA